MKNNTNSEFINNINEKNCEKIERYKLLIFYFIK